MLQDSGNRREFETGAVRDMAEGKGRCDLLPLDVIAQHMGDPVLAQIHFFMENREQHSNLWTALVYFAQNAWDMENATRKQRLSNMILEVSKHFEDGALKYGDRNWEKGLPIYSFIDSAIRHYLKYLRGDTDEPHDRAFVWNILCCIWTLKHHPEL